MSAVRFHRHVFAFPSRETPAWSGAVDRWYQLDAFAYGLADATYRWRGEVPQPELVFLASEAASNDTDAKFARGGASSPSKFVHTLPNVRVSSLCLVLEWRGPVICLQKDPQTVIFALNEAVTFPGRCWVTGVRALSSDQFEAYLFEVAPEENAPAEFPRAADDSSLWQQLAQASPKEWYRYEQ